MRLLLCCSVAAVITMVIGWMVIYHLGIDPLHDKGLSAYAIEVPICLMLCFGLDRMTRHKETS